MRIRPLLQIKIWYLLLLLFIGCNGLSQSKIDTPINHVGEEQLTEVKTESIDTRTEKLIKITKNNEYPVSNDNYKPNDTKLLAFGHKEIRRLLGNDIGQMNFNSQAANTFRIYMANTLLSSRSNSYNSSGFTDSNAKIQFCANGTFVQALSGHVSIDVEGLSGGSASTDYMPGYWEVASMPNDMLIILFYSTHSSMLEDSPNGFLPFPVAKYTTNFVSLPNGDGYTRIANQYCN